MNIVNWDYFEGVEREEDFETYIKSKRINFNNSKTGVKQVA